MVLCLFVCLFTVLLYLWGELFNKETIRHENCKFSGTIRVIKKKKKSFLIGFQGDIFLINAKKKRMHQHLKIFKGTIKKSSCYIINLVPFLSFKLTGFSP